MTIDPVEVAKRFHDVYERLAPQFGYETRPDTKQFDPNTPNGKLMVAVCGEIGQQLFDEGYDDCVKNSGRF